jgi:AmmeMemoRadiSam system protein B
MRKSTLAGSWYPGEKNTLSQLIEDLLIQSDPPDIQGNIFGLIAPHAGIQFSGRAAACAYRLLQGRDIKCVILIGPSHYQGFRGLAVSGADAYETPLGRMRVDQKSAGTLAALPLFQGPCDADLPEHSLEMHVPFLQTVLPDCDLLPLVAGHVSADECMSVARELKGIMDDRTIVAVSSDFTHYGERFGYVPFQDNIRENLHALDSTSIDCILKKDPGAFAKHVAETGTTICGSIPIELFLNMLPRESHGALVDYYTSGDILGDYTDTVSYASIVFMTD